MFAEKLAGIVYLVINDPACPIVIDHMYNLQNDIVRPGKDSRASERPIGPFGEIGRKHDLFHGLPSSPSTEGE